MCIRDRPLQSNRWKTGNNKIKSNRGGFLTLPYVYSVLHPVPEAVDRLRRLGGDVYKRQVHTALNPVNIVATRATLFAYYKELYEHLGLYEEYKPQIYKSVSYTHLDVYKRQP